MQMNKQGTIFFWNVLLIHERHCNSYYIVPVAFLEVTRMISSKNPDNSPKALACFPYIPPLMHEQSGCDITKWCENHLLPLFSRKGTVHVQESCTDLPVYPPASPLTIFYSYIWTMSSFPYPKFWACGTLPQVIWCTLHQSLKFIKIQYVQLLKNNRHNVNNQDGDTLSSNNIRVS